MRIIIKNIKLILSLLIFSLLCSYSYFGKNQDEISNIYLEKTPIGMSMNEVRDYLISELGSNKKINIGENEPCKKIINTNPVEFMETSQHLISANLGWRMNGLLPQYIFGTWCFDGSRKLIELHIKTETDSI